MNGSANGSTHISRVLFTLPTLLCNTCVLTSEAVRIKRFIAICGNRALFLWLHADKVNTDNRKFNCILPFDNEMGIRSSCFRALIIDRSGIQNI